MILERDVIKTAVRQKVIELTSELGEGESDISAEDIVSATGDFDSACSEGRLIYQPSCEKLLFNHLRDGVLPLSGQPNPNLRTQ